MTCEPAAGWTPDLTRGLLEFLEPSTGAVYYTIPNHAVRFHAEAETELMIGVLEGDDIDVSSDPAGAPPTETLVVSRPRKERLRTSTIYLQMNFWYDETGVPHPNAGQGRYLNWANLSAVADVTLNKGTNYDAYSTAGLQTVRWTPYTGAGTVTIPEVHVMPPQPGNLTRGIGMTVTLPFEITDPSPLP